MTEGGGARIALQGAASLQGTAAFGNLEGLQQRAEERTEGLTGNWAVERTDGRAGWRKGDRTYMDDFVHLQVTQSICGHRSLASQIVAELPKLLSKRSF